MNSQVRSFLNKYAGDHNLLNMVIVSAYLDFNGLSVKYNKLLLSLIHGVDRKESDALLELVRSSSNEFTLEDVIALFEASIPTADVALNGAIYTPMYIREYISNNTVSYIDIRETTKIADIACGSGSFLYTVSKYIKETTSYALSDIYKNNIFGLDISAYAIERTKILLCLFAISMGEDLDVFEFNLYVGNTLSFEWEEVDDSFSGFDAIIGNPPYVGIKNMDAVSKSLLSRWSVTRSGKMDLYIPFFEIGVKNLKPNGHLGYITVNTFKRSLNGRELRKFFSNESFCFKMFDFGHHQVFDGKLTYTCMVLIQKSISPYLEYSTVSPDDILFDKDISLNRICYEALDDKSGWLLGDDVVFKNIQLIQNAGTHLGDMVNIKGGLATLQNSIYIFSPTDEDDIYFYIERDGEKHKIEKAICRNVIKPNKLKKEEDIDRLMEKIIFPYLVTDEVAKVMEEDYFKVSYPFAYNYLMGYKTLLLQRDKGKETSYVWFEYGRSQALNHYGEKILFPMMSNRSCFLHTADSDLMIYCGYALYGKSTRELMVIQKILKSSVFWYYIQHTSKPYSSNYYSFAKNYIKDFGICDLTIEEEDFLLTTSSEAEINKFLISKYGII